jgi:hypothetical protein
MIIKNPQQTLTHQYAAAAVPAEKEFFR